MFIILLFINGEKNLEYKSDGLFLKNIVFESINWKVGEIGVGRGVW